MKLAIAIIASSLGACTECTISAHVGRFADEHDPVDCGYAHMFSLDGETGVVGASIARECILDALATSRAFMGGYILAGIDSSNWYAYLGSAHGDVQLLVQDVGIDGSISMLSTSCDRLEVAATPAPQFSRTIGLQCVGEDLQPMCTMPREE